MHLYTEVAQRAHEQILRLSGELRPGRHLSEEQDRAFTVRPADAFPGHVVEITPVRAPHPRGNDERDVSPRRARPGGLPCDNRPGLRGWRLRKGQRADHRNDQRSAQCRHHVWLPHEGRGRPWSKRRLSRRGLSPHVSRQEGPPRRPARPSGGHSAIASRFGRHHSTDDTLEPPPARRTTNLPSILAFKRCKTPTIAILSEVSLPNWTRRLQVVRSPGQAGLPTPDGHSPSAGRSLCPPTLAGPALTHVSRLRPGPP